MRDKNLLYLEFPGNEVLSFYDIKDVLDQYDCTGYKRDWNPELNKLMFVIYKDQESWQIHIVDSISKTKLIHCTRTDIVNILQIWDIARLPYL